MPKDWRLGWSEPTEANVTFSGSERAFDLLDPAQVALSIDLSNIREGRQEVPINEAHIRSASNLSVFQINPSIVMLEAHRVVRVELPVKVQTVGRLDSVLELAEIKAVPDTLLVNVIQNRMEELKEINTEPVDLSSITETTTLTVPLNLPEIARLREPQPSGVRVTVTLKVPEETS
jgi:YbbR domain-containing protein